MANRRMINKSISVSEQVNELSDFAALLFSWLIPHTDDYGVIPGSSRKIKALVIPMREQSAEQVETALSEMKFAGLIWRYIYKGNEYLQFCKFDEHQEGLHKRTKPKNPIYLEVSGDSGNFREIPGNSRLIEPNLIELNLIEGKGNVPEKSATPLKTQKEPTADKKSKYTYDQEHMQLANILKYCILENNPNAKVPELPENWANEIRLMISQDNRDPTVIAHVIQWCQKNQFWKGNILSADSLRKQFDKLFLQMQESSSGEKLTTQQKNLNNMAEALRILNEGEGIFHDQ